MIATRHSENAVMPPPDPGIMELSFMISRAQFEALEQAAQLAHISVAQYLRRLVQSSLVLGTLPASDLAK